MFWSERDARLQIALMCAKMTGLSLQLGSESIVFRKPEYPMRILLQTCAVIASVGAMMTLSSSEASAVFWRGLSAPTNIDYHGWVIIKEYPYSPCQWIHVNGYYVRQCIR
jgi:hypothetical protein